MQESQEASASERIRWYRCRLTREELAELNQRSDFMGLLQSGGYLALLVATGSAAVLSVGHLPWAAVALLFFCHGTCYNFMINGFHELVHDSVFKSPWLNRAFLVVFSFLGLYNHHHFWASHTEHHKYTLHPPRDMEVVLPMRVTFSGFLKDNLLNPRGLYWALKGTFRHACGKLDGPWEEHIFRKHETRRQQMVLWARILLIGHGAIACVAFFSSAWWLPLLVTGGRFYGGALHFLCNQSQHIGLTDRVPDFRLCCRTIILNPVLRFLYWHMNYHIEHHMYAAVPCYNLGKLHRRIRHELPHCPRGLLETWKQIAWISKQQEEVPGYQYKPELPERSGSTESAPQPMSLASGY